MGCMVYMRFMGGRGGMKKAQASGVAGLGSRFVLRAEARLDSPTFAVLAFDELIGALVVRNLQVLGVPFNRATATECDVAYQNGFR